MYYRLNGVTQRLTGAPAAACSPQTLRPGVPPVSPPVIFSSPTKLVEVEFLGANRVSELQRLFQRSDGLPVHLKGGVIDKLLYRSTTSLTLGGVVYCLVALYFAVQPDDK